MIMEEFRSDHMVCPDSAVSELCMKKPVSCE